MARWTLFDGGERSARTAQSAFTAEGWALRLEDRQRRAMQRFDQAVMGLQTLSIESEIAAQRTGSAAEALRLTKQGFDAGRLTATDLAEAVLEASQTLEEATETDARQRIEQARLLALVGVLVDQAVINQALAPPTGP